MTTTTRRRRKYKTKIEYEKELDLMRRKASKWLEDHPGVHNRDVDDAAMLMFRQKWINAKNGLRLVTKFPDREGR